MLTNFLIINVDELWLKGKNRPSYFKKLKQQIQNLLKHLELKNYELSNESNSFHLNLESTVTQQCIDYLCKIPGINCVIPAVEAHGDVNDMFLAIKDELSNIKENITFKVETKRAFKKFPKDSMTISRELGGHVLENFENFKVNVKNPDFKIEVKVYPDKHLLSFKRYSGVCGLPVGTSGKLLTLISGGFDSPVASYLMSRRGCEQNFIFFHAYPYVGDEVLDKIEKICSKLSVYQGGSKLFICPFGKIQKQIADTCSPEYKTLLFRKYMIDTAEKLSKQLEYDALLTGDCLAQVSSQAIGNLKAIESETTALIFRPLLGMNKLDIINTSKSIGLFDTSVIPHDDACSLFAPKFPVIKPSMKYWAKYIRNHNYEELIDQALEEMTIIKFDCLGKKVKS